MHHNKPTSTAPKKLPTLHFTPSSSVAHCLVVSTTLRTTDYTGLCIFNRTPLYRLNYNASYRLHCTVLPTLRCTVISSLHCTGLSTLDCTALYYLHCTTLRSTDCTALYCLHCTALYYLHWQHCSALSLQARSLEAVVSVHSL